MRHGLCIFLGLLLVILPTGSRALQSGGSSRGAKSLPLPELYRRTRFTVLLPHARAYKLQDARLIWVVKTELAPKLPARQAVGLLYQGLGRAHFVIMQARALKGIAPYDNLDLVRGEGYLFNNLEMGSRQQYGRVNGTDYGIVSVGLSDQDISKLARSLRGEAKHRRADREHSTH